MQCCMVGVCHLSLMLSARAPLDSHDEYTAHDTNISHLLQEGMYSFIIAMATSLVFV